MMLFQIATIGKHGGVLHLGSDDVPLVGAAHDRRVNGSVVGFRRATGKDDLVSRLGANHCGHLIPRLFDYRFQVGAEAVGT